MPHQVPFLGDYAFSRPVLQLNQSSSRRTNMLGYAVCHLDPQAMATILEHIIARLVMHSTFASTVSSLESFALTIGTI